MAEEVISVKFIGEDGNLSKSLGTLQSQLRRFQDAMKAAGNVESLQRLQRAADATKARIDALNRAAAGGGAGAQKMTKDFTGLTRVIQDLPFGFVAISNNIEQLLPAAGGLGLAISSITAAITFASVGFGAWTRGFDGASKAAEKHVSAVLEAKKALDTFVQSLDDVRQARVTGAQNAQDELVSLKSLYDATQNANIPLSKRKELVDALQEQYPKYFANIKDETILAGGAKSAYDRLTASILATARARAAQDALVDIQKQVLAIEEQQVSAMQRQYDAFKNIDKITKSTQNSKLNTNLSQTGNAGAAAVFNVNKVTQATEEYNDRLKESAKLNSQRNELLARAARLTSEITDITVENPDALLKAGAKVKEIKVKVDKVRISRIEHIDFESPDDFFKRAAEQFNTVSNKDFEEFVKKKFSSVTIQPRVDIVPKDIHTDPTGLNKAVQNLLDVEAFNKKLAELKAGIKSFSDYTGQALGAAFTSVFDALLSGEDPLKAFLNSIKQTVKQVAADLITTYIRVAVFKALAAPATGGASGITGILGLLGSFAGFSKGGLVPGSGNGDTVPAMLTPGELVIPKQFAPQVGALLKNLRLGNMPTPAAARPQSVGQSGNYVGNRAMTIKLQGQLSGHGSHLLGVIDQEIKAQGRYF